MKNSLVVSKNTCIYVLRVCFVSVRESWGVFGLWDCEFMFMRFVRSLFIFYVGKGSECCEV